MRPERFNPNPADQTGIPERKTTRLVIPMAIFGRGSMAQGLKPDEDVTVEQLARGEAMQSAVIVLWSTSRHPQLRLCLHSDAEMAGDGVSKEDVFLARAGADVVQDQGGAVGGDLAGHNADGGEVTRKGPGHDVAGQPRGRLVCQRQGGTDAGEQGGEVRHAAVTYVAVSCSQAPESRAGREIGLHVAVDGQLQVDPPASAQGADHHIGADATIARQITAGEGEGGAPDPEQRVASFRRET